METPVIKTYCDFVKKLSNDNVHKHYHDNEYGYPLHSDNELFARLVLEINLQLLPEQLPYFCN